MRIEGTANATLARVSPFPVFPVPSTHFPVPVADDDVAAGYFVSTLRQRCGYVLSIIDASDD